MLIRNRIPIDVPVVDEVDLDGLEPGALVAVEVVAEGRAYRAMADPIALCVALELGHDRIQHVARIHPRAGGFPCHRRHRPHRAARSAVRRRRLRRLHRRRSRGAVYTRAGAQRAAAGAAGQRRAGPAAARSRRRRAGHRGGRRVLHRPLVDRQRRVAAARSRRHQGHRRGAAGRRPRRRRGGHPGTPDRTADPDDRRRTRGGRDRSHARRRGCRRVPWSATSAAAPSI